MKIKFHITRIPKGGGKFREIYVASEEDGIALRSLLPELHALHDRCDDTGAAYAFRPNRNCALMALQHIGSRYVLSMDLENFFESITEKHVEGVLEPTLIDYCFIDGRLRQGLPTSPVISNIAFCPFDKAIVNALRLLKIDAVYTRYADDLVFGYSDAAAGGKIKVVVKQILERGGFKINETKTRIQSVKNGRVIVAGIALDSTGLHPTRRTRKRIRAALHQGNSPSASGLLEWSRCKLPNVLLTAAQLSSTANRGENIRDASLEFPSNSLLGWT